MKGKKKIEVPDSWQENKEFFRDISRQLEKYFAGKLKSFDVKLAPEGTEFQKSVWKALCEIPYGETRTYGQIAKTLESRRLPGLWGLQTTGTQLQ